MRTRELHAFMGKSHVGVFRESTNSNLDTETTFVYDDGYSGTPLSLSLPIGGPHSPHAAGSFLDNLLPDNMEVRKRWASDRILLGIDPFTLLQEYGEDCAGAVSLSKNEDLSHRRESPETLFEATDDDIAARIASLNRDDTSWNDPRVKPRMSLPGNQGKFTLARIGDRWFYPTYEVPSTHIFKPPHQLHEDIEILESLGLKLARECGLFAARSEVMSFLDQKTFATQRWDRSDGVRLHSEDMNQALGRPTNDKYAVRARDVINVLRDEELIDSFIAQLAFNTSFGNGDAHAKNYSVLLRGNRVVMSPLYDTVPTIFYPLYNNQFAMRIGKASRSKSLTEENWRRMARAAGLDEDHVCEVAFPVISSVAEKYEEVFRDALKGSRSRTSILRAHVRRLTTVVPPKWTVPAIVPSSSPSSGGCGAPMPRAKVPCILPQGHGDHCRSVIPIRC